MHVDGNCDGNCAPRKEGFRVCKLLLAFKRLKYTIVAQSLPGAPQGPDGAHFNPLLRRRLFPRPDATSDGVSRAGGVRVRCGGGGERERERERAEFQGLYLFLGGLLLLALGRKPESIILQQLADILGLHHARK